MRPIPKSLLIHTVKMHKKGEEDRWGKGDPDYGMELTHVRMEPSGKIVRDKNNAEVQLAAVLFYDCKNSSPRDVEFCVDDIIVFNGIKHKIETVEPLYDNKRLHHYELGLIKSA